MLCRSVIRFCCRSHHSCPQNEPISLLMQRHSISKSIQQCKQIHARLIISQPISELYVSNTLLNFYAKCGDLCSAHTVFDQMPQKNVVTWTSLISSYVHHGSSDIALEVLKKMLESGERPNQYTLSIAVRACTDIGFVELGLQIHGLIVHIGHERDGFSGSSLVEFYFKIGGSLDDAFRVFDGLFKRDFVTWNVMISGFAQEGEVGEVLRLVSEMRAVDGLKPNCFTFTSLLKCCYLVKEVEQIHGLAIKFGTEIDGALGSAFVDLYGKCGDMNLSLKVFKSIETKDTFAWSSIISGYARNGKGEEAVISFRNMCRQGVLPVQHALSSALKGCVEIGDHRTGIQLHTQVIKNGAQSDCFVASVLLTLYADANQICEAEKLFRRIDEIDIVAWNSMIMAYARMEEGSASSCFNIFRELCQTTTLKPDETTLMAVLKSCWSSCDLAAGIQIHSVIVKLSRSCETVIGNAIINMYSNCGSVDDAHRAFDELVHRDEISWNSLIRNFQQNGFELEALKHFKEMLADGISLTSFSLSSCVAACSELAAIDVGKQCHSCTIKCGFEREVYVGSAIIDMYAKCGNLEDSEKAFEEQEDPNEATFSALISGFAQHGKASKAIGLFDKMEKTSLVPTRITFLAVLSACSHAGLLKESLYFFNLMLQKYNIEPELEHYSCLIDVFGRAGRLEEAYEIIRDDKNVLAWKTLLSACRNYGNERMADKCGKKMMELDPGDQASYILLSNLYSGEGKWEEAGKVRRKMVGIGVKKSPGSSWLII